MPSIQYFQKSESVKNVFSVKPIIFGTVTAVVISIVLLTSASLLFLYSGISQNFIPIASKLILFLSILSGGIISGCKSKTSGWLYGASTGCVFFILLIALNFLTGLGVEYSLALLLIFLCCMLVGSTGGVIGINIKPKRKH